MRCWIPTIVLIASAMLTAPAFGAEVEQSSSGSIEQAFVSLLERGDPAGLLAITLIFGSGIIAVAGVAITSIIRALRQGSASVDDVLEKLDSIEARIAAIEQAVPKRQI